MKWPRRNDAESIAARRAAIRGVVGDEPLAHDDEAWSRAQESHTGAALIPVSVVGPLLVELGSYELEEPEGTLRETGRAQEELLVPLAHTEGGLSASMSRGLKAAASSDGFRTYVLQDRMTRASCFICKDTEDAVTLASWLEGSVDDLRAFLAGLDDPTLSKRASNRDAWKCINASSASVSGLAPIGCSTRTRASRIASSQSSRRITVSGFAEL